MMVVSGRRLCYADSAEVREGVCPECNGSFVYTKHHRYVRTEGRKEIFYCSYTCFRIKDKLDREKEKEAFQWECQFLERQYARAAKYRQRIRDRKRLGESREYAILITRQDAMKYMEKAQTMVMRCSKELLDSDKGSAEHRRASKNLQRWERKLKYAKEQAEILPEEQGG